MLTNCLAVCAHLTITVSEIQRDICEKIVIFYHTPLHSTPPLGGSRRNIATPFGMEQLEWWGYPIVKKIEDIYNGLDTIPACNRRTDRQTDILPRHIRAMHTRRAVKTLALTSDKPRCPKSAIITHFSSSQWRHKTRLHFPMTSCVTSQKIFNANNIVKNINTLSSPHPISGIYILQEWNPSLSNNLYVNCVYRLHRGPLFLRHSVNIQIVFGSSRILPCR